jgi:hypothetical protein
MCKIIVSIHSTFNGVVTGPADDKTNFMTWAQAGIDDIGPMSALVDEVVSQSIRRRIGRPHPEGKRKTQFFSDRQLGRAERLACNRVQGATASLAFTATMAL